MNDKIKELAEQAGVSFLMEDDHSMVMNAVDLEKFAELMVEKFDLILVNEYLDCVGENDKKSQFRIDRLRKRIKEHFGVE